MRISACAQLPQDTDPEIVIATERMKFQKLMEEAVSQMQQGQWYAAKLETETLTESCAMRLKTSLTLEAIPEKTAVCVSPEDMFLKDEKSFWQKIKNCIAYLMDKTGGKIEWRRKRGNEDE